MKLDYGKEKKYRKVPPVIQEQVDAVFDMYTVKYKEKLTASESRMFLRDLALKHYTRVNCQMVTDLMDIVDL